MTLENFDVDVLVIGAGIAGLSAAVSAREAGAEHVMIAEADEIVGGSARLSQGIIVGAGSKLQKAAGIEDSPDAQYRDWQVVNQWIPNGAVTRRLADESGAMVDWLADMGTEFHPTPVIGGSESVPRCAVPLGHGQGIIDALARRARELDVEIAFKQRIDRLIVEDGVVVGAAVGDDEIRAAAVILTTGGIGASPSKLAEFYPSVAQHGDWVWYIGSPNSRGDGIDLGRQVDASIIGKDRGLRVLTPNFVREQDPYQPGWLVFINQDGRRFMSESAHYSVIARLVDEQPGPLYALFDQQAVDPELAAQMDSYKGGAAGYPGREPRKSNHWNPETMQRAIDSGQVLVADTIEELAAKAGVDARQLVATVDQYNAGAESGTDAMGKPADFLRKLDHGPFYAAEVRLAIVAVTGAGVHIDADARVLNELGYPVSGLYAAGETTGSMIWPVYPSSGASLSSSATMGRVAGRHAAARAKSVQILA